MFVCVHPVTPIASRSLTFLQPSLSDDHGGLGWILKLVLKSFGAPVHLIAYILFFDAWLLVFSLFLAKQMHCILAFLLHLLTPDKAPKCFPRGQISSYLVCYPWYVEC